MPHPNIPQQIKQHYCFHQIVPNPDPAKGRWICVVCGKNLKIASGLKIGRPLPKSDSDRL
jgi:hypothetical protein